jgi:hypothetical protein
MVEIKIYKLNGSQGAGPLIMHGSTPLTSEQGNILHIIYNGIEMWRDNKFILKFLNAEHC